jgi:hypothetical protein
MTQRIPDGLRELLEQAAGAGSGSLAHAAQPGDWLLLLCCAALVAVLPLLWRGGVADRAIVKRDGQLVTELALNVARKYEVTGAIGTTVIEVQPGRARVLSDPGPRQYCVQQGWLTRANAVAICAPNHVTLQLAGRGGRMPAMTPSTIELPVTADDYRIARYAAAAIALSVAETALPSPLPGIKPGLANIIVLVVLARYGWRDAAWVSLLRVVAGSLVIGQFLAPGFFLALAGALCSLAVLAAGAAPAAAFFRPGVGQRAGGLRPHRRPTAAGARLAGAP